MWEKIFWLSPNSYSMNAFSESRPVIGQSQIKTSSTTTRNNNNVSDFIEVILILHLWPTINITPNWPVTGATTWNNIWFLSWTVDVIHSHANVSCVYIRHPFPSDSSFLARRSILSSASAKEQVSIRYSLAPTALKRFQIDQKLRFDIEMAINWNRPDASVIFPEL